MWKDRESGQSLIIITLIVIVILALVALVVDVGNAYAYRRMVQNACDAAALAGARRLAERGIDEQEVLEIQVLRDIERFAGENDLERDKVRAWFIDHDGDQIQRVYPSADPVPEAAEGVEVAGDRPFDTYFAHLLGFPRMTASTTAKAWVLTGPCSGDNLFPLTVSTGVFSNTAGVPEIGYTYTLWDHNDPHSPGNWGWLYWEDGDGNCRCPYPDECCPQGPSARDLEDNMVDTSRSGNWAVGDWVSGAPGVVVGGVLDVLFPYVTDEPWPMVIIPLYDQMRGTGNNTKYRIGGFAAFQLNCVYSSRGHYRERDGACAPCDTGSSDDKCIRGQFVEMVEPSGLDGCMETGISIPSFRQPRSSP
jgi:hypothetical protein